MSCAPHRLSAVSGLTRCGVLAMGQRLFKSDARLSGSNYTPITQQTLYAEDGIGSTVLGQYGNRRSTNSAAPAGELDGTEVIYLPTASGPMPIAAQINGRLYAIDSDHLNTPRRLTNQQGQVAWQWLITGFGETAPTQGAQGYAQPDISSVNSYAEAVSFDLRYPGQQWDEETGLSYNLHRYYDAATGRYTQADPIGLDGGWNRFAYVGGNPLLFIDPEGLRSARPAAPGGNAYNRRQWRRHGPGSFERPTGEGTVCDHLGLLGRVELEHEIRWKAPRIAFDGLIQGLGGHAVEFGQVGMRASYVSYPGRLRRI